MLKSIKKYSEFTETITTQEEIDSDWGLVASTNLTVKSEEVILDNNATTNTSLVTLDPYGINKYTDISVISDTGVSEINIADSVIGNFNSVKSNTMTASDAQDNSSYGRNVTLTSDGLVMVVGAFTYDTTAGTDAGKVYTYKRATIDDTWTEVNQLTASDAADSDRFGHSVALSSDGLILVVGTHTADTAGTDAGKVYTYKRATIDDAWVEVNQLTASDAQNYDYFGISVAISDDGLILVVGAPGEDTAVNYGGKVYTYKRATVNDTWTEVNQLTASDAADSDEFGFSVSVNSEGLILLVGAWRKDGTYLNEGKVYTYKRATIDDAWTEVNQITPSNVAADDYRFGVAASISDNGLLAIISNYTVNVNTATPSTVTLYKRATIDDVWTEITVLQNDTGSASFGVTLSLAYGSKILALGDQLINNGQGEVYMYKIGYQFTKDITSLNLTTAPTKAFVKKDVNLYIDLEANKNEVVNNSNTFYLNIKDTTATDGTNIITDYDERLLPGTTLTIDTVKNNIVGITGGEVDLTQIIEVNQLTASDAADSDYFGISVALSSDGLVLTVGARAEDTAGTDAGKVYTYKRATIDDTWVEVNQLTASDAADSDYFGSGVALSSDGLILVVGAHAADTAATDAGKVYTYKRATIDDTWVEVNQLTASDAADSDYFGSGVALSSDGLVLVVGAASEDTADTDAGKVYTYKRATIDDAWTEVNQLTASDAAASDHFGFSVALSGDGLVAMVGAYTEDTAGTDAGKVYTYTRATIDDVWTEVNQLTASDAADSDQFGISVALSSDGLVLVVSAYAEDTAASDAGKVYVYKRATIDDAWTEVNQLTASDAQDSDLYGRSVGLSGNGLVLVVGAYTEDTAASDAGKVYTYKHNRNDLILDITNHGLTSKPTKAYLEGGEYTKSFNSVITSNTQTVFFSKPTVNLNDKIYLDYIEVNVDSVENSLVSDLTQITEVNQLTASDATANDYFGVSVYLSGDGLVLIVGAYGSDTAATDAGKVYTYKRATIDDTWVEVNQLTASDAQASDYFGSGVALSSDGLVLIVGAIYEDTADTDAGKVYTYTRATIDDAWTEVNQLTASDAAANDQFGISVALSSDGLVLTVGARAEDTAATDAGKVYTYKRATIDDTWVEVNQLTASDAAANDQFGQSLDLSSDGLNMVVGAYLQDTAGTDAGKVYTYKRATIDDAWTEVNQLTASDAAASDQFGVSVSINTDGTVLVVGAYSVDNLDADTGKVYLYQRVTINDAWTEVNQLTASDAVASDNFGIDVAISSDGKTLVVGAHCSDTAATDAGKVYAYKLGTITRNIVTHVDIGKQPKTIIVPNRGVLVDLNYKSYDSVSNGLKYTFNDYYKQGRAISRKLTAIEPDTYLVEPLTSTLQKVQ